MVKDDKNEKETNKTINTENKLNNSKLLQTKINKVYSPIRKINSNTPLFLNKYFDGIVIALFSNIKLTAGKQKSIYT